MNWRLVCCVPAMYIYMRVLCVHCMCACTSYYYDWLYELYAVLECLHLLYLCVCRVHLILVVSTLYLKEYEHAWRVSSSDSTGMQSPLVKLKSFSWQYQKCLCVSFVYITLWSFWNCMCIFVFVCNFHCVIYNAVIVLSSWSGHFYNM